MSRKQSRARVDWRKGIINVSSRGPVVRAADGTQSGVTNGGVAAVGSAIGGVVRTTFVHKHTLKEHDSDKGRPCIAITDNDRTTCAEFIDPEAGDKAREVAMGSAWFQFHANWNRSDAHMAFATQQEVEAGRQADENTSVRASREAECRLALDRCNRGMAAMQTINAGLARVVHKLWIEDNEPRPVMIHDFDQHTLVEELIKLDPRMADYLLYEHHVMFPHPDSIPDFYRGRFEAFATTALGGLNGSIRAMGLQTRADQVHFGEFVGRMPGYRFHESIMAITCPNGQRTYLGRTPAGVQWSEFASNATPPDLSPAALHGFLPRVTGQAWTRGKKFIMIVTRPDDPNKNIRRAIDAIGRLLALIEKAGLIDLRDNLVVVLVGFPSRAGIPTYSSYLAERTSQVGAFNERHRIGEHIPIIWLHEKAIDQSVVAQFYGHPNCLSLFMPPKFEALGLGGPEFIAGQDWKRPDDAPAPGVLCMSKTAGAYTYLGSEGVLSLNPRSAEQMGEALFEGITMLGGERRYRMQQLRAAAQQFDMANLVPAALEHAFVQRG